MIRSFGHPVYQWWDSTRRSKKSLRQLPNVHIANAKIGLDVRHQYIFGLIITVILNTAKDRERPQGRARNCKCERKHRVTLKVC